MTELVVAVAAAADLAELIRTHSLPSDTVARVRRSLEPLARFPLVGAQLEGRYEGARFLLGPWRWLVLIYLFDSAADRVTLVAVIDGRTSPGIR